MTEQVLKILFTFFHILLLYIGLCHIHTLRLTAPEWLQKQLGKTVLMLDATAGKQSHPDIKLITFGLHKTHLTYRINSRTANKLRR